MKQVRWTFWLGSSLGKDLGLPRWRLDLDRDYEGQVDKEIQEEMIR